jgi:hypothetical protein
MLVADNGLDWIEYRTSANRKAPLRSMLLPFEN